MANIFYSFSMDSDPIQLQDGETLSGYSKPKVKTHNGKEYLYFKDGKRDLGPNFSVNTVSYYIHKENTDRNFYREIKDCHHPSITTKGIESSLGYSR